MLNLDNDLTFDTFDKLKLKTFASRLLKHVLADNFIIDGSLVISLNGKFGSGKTCFLKMFENYLKEKNQEVIYINSWKNDFFDEPIVTFVSEFVGYVEAIKNNPDSDKFKKLEDYLYKVIGAIVSVGNQLVRKVAGIDSKEVLKDIKNAGEQDDILLGSSVYQEYCKKKALFQGVNDLIEQITQSDSGKPIFVLVDELDRARPDYAVKFLEMLKHFFWAKGLIFILAVDKEHLEASVKSLYGSGINFPEYYRKFINRNVSLPKMSEEVSRAYVIAQIEKYFSKERDRKFVVKFGDTEKTIIVDLCLKLELSPRQINELFFISSHFLHTQKDYGMGTTESVMAAFIYLAMFLSDEAKTRKIYQARHRYDDYLSFFRRKNIINEDDFSEGYTEFLMRIILFITSNRQTHKENTKKYMSVIQPNLSSETTEYESAVQGLRFPPGSRFSFNRDTSIIEEIAQHIDECLTFYDKS